MTSKERLVWQGQKQEKQLEMDRLESSIKGLIGSVRTELNPHSPIDEIDPGVVSQQAFELSEKLIRYNALNKEVKAINKSLGIE